MKYFCENTPEYHAACAGSLLGLAPAKPSSFPLEVKLHIRSSPDNLKPDGDVLNIPLFLAGQTERLIGVARKYRI